MLKDIKELLDRYKENKNLMSVQFAVKHDIYEPLNPFINKYCMVSVIIDDVINQRVRVENIHIPYKSNEQLKREQGQIIEYLKRKDFDIICAGKTCSKQIYNRPIIDRLKCNMEHMEFTSINGI